MLEITSKSKHLERFWQKNVKPLRYIRPKFFTPSYPQDSYRGGDVITIRHNQCCANGVDNQRFTQQISRVLPKAFLFFRKSTDKQGGLRQLLSIKAWFLIDNWFSLVVCIFFFFSVRFSTLSQLWDSVSISKCSSTDLVISSSYTPIS